MKNELEQFNEGLDNANQDANQGDDDFEVPSEVEKAFAGCSIEEIRQRIEEARAAGTAALIQLGFAYMALKSKLKGKFKATIIAEKGMKGYLAAWRAVCRAKAFLLLPEVAQQLGRGAVHKVLSLSADDICSLRAKLIGVTPEIAKTITEEALESADNDRILDRHHRWRGSPKGQRHTTKAREKRERDLEQREIDKLEQKIETLKEALRAVAELEIDYTKHAERAKKFVRELCPLWDEVACNLLNESYNVAPISDDDEDIR